jgi:hypothetical protein
MKDEPTSVAQPLRSPAIERCVDPEVLDWYRMSPQERWTESMRLWSTFHLLGGRLEPESDSQSPFYDAGARRAGTAHGRPGLHSVRRGGV